MSKLAELLTNQTSKFAVFLRDSKIDPVRVLHVSHRLETLQPEDRAIKAAKKKSAGKEEEAAKAARARKPRSGRPVTERLLRAAIAGESVSGPSKNRLLRAVNEVCTQKKLPVTELRKLF